MAEVILLDTSIVSIFLKISTAHDGRRAAIEASTKGKVPTISFVTVAELLYWPEVRGWGAKRRDELDERLRLYEVLDPSAATCAIWAKTKHKLKTDGIPVASNDLWIASAAIEHGLPIYSADKDFSRVPGVAFTRL